MRKVTVFKWVAAHKDGNVFMEKAELCKGLFHQFGCDFEEFESGAGNYTTAIVELPSGEIITPCVDLIRFDDKPVI